MSAKPVRVQLRREKGWRLPPNTVVVGRPNHWGNPFRIGKLPDEKLLARYGWKIKPGHWDDVCPDAKSALERFTGCIAFDGASAWAARIELGGKNLACWCKLAEPCHADVLLKIANGERIT